MTRKISAQSLHDGQVLRLELDAPPGNILDGEMMAEIDEELKAARNKPDLKLLQFLGAGDHFSFGASVEEHRKENAARMLEQFHGLFETLMDLALPTAGLLSGQCLGGGFELALFCQFLFADRSAKGGQPEIRLGVFAPPASLLLPLRIGQSRADELLLTGRSASADELQSIGLVHHVYETRDEMLSGVDEWVQKNILPKSASSLRFAVKAARCQFHKVLRKSLGELALLYNEELMETHDANEGIQSFLEKRKPQWKNQ